MQINLSAEYQLDKVQIAIDDLFACLKLRFVDADISAAFSRAALPEPDSRTIKMVRKYCMDKSETIMTFLCDQVEKRFDRAPKKGEVVAFIDAAGYQCSRNFRIELQRRLKERNAERWGNPTTEDLRLRVHLNDGERALWLALSRSYDMNSPEVAAMLLKVFLITVKTGRINLLDVPFLISSLADKELKMYAESLNFIIPKDRKTRVR